MRDKGEHPTLAENYDHYVTYDGQGLFCLYYEYNGEFISTRRKDGLTEEQAIDFATSTWRMMISNKFNNEAIRDYRMTTFLNTYPV